VPDREGWAVACQPLHQLPDFAVLEGAFDLDRQSAGLGTRTCPPGIRDTRDGRIYWAGNAPVGASSVGPASFETASSGNASLDTASIGTASWGHDPLEALLIGRGPRLALGELSCPFELGFSCLVALLRLPVLLTPPLLGRLFQRLMFRIDRARLLGPLIGPPPEFTGELFPRDDGALAAALRRPLARCGLVASRPPTGGLEAPRPMVTRPMVTHGAVAQRQRPAFLRGFHRSPVRWTNFELNTLSV
jgi:hypothetical protein